ncbi:MAG: phage head closure protein [Hyphomicrobiaceae bacterium]|nr:phage head closure protein [Hyphomicrobiaceae bacterium]
MGRAGTNMRAGALRHRISLESMTKTDDGGGGVAIIWEEIAPLWVAIKPLSGRERLGAGQYASRLTHEITLRYRTLALPEMRFRKGNRIFEITAVINVDEKSQWLRALCEEREL